MSDATKDPFGLVTLTQFNDEPPAEVHFLWGDKTNGLMQQQSFVLLHSGEKQGKSMFTLNLAVAGARGDADFLGIPLRPGGFKTMIIQSEVHNRGVWERFQEMCRDGELTREQSDRIMLNTNRSVSLAIGENRGFLKYRIRKFRPDIVVIDPLAHLLTEDENSNAAVGKALAPLLKLRDDPGCTVIVVHHDGKFNEASAGRPVHQRSRGANRLTADPDSIWSLTPMSSKKRRTPTSKFACLPRYGAQMEPFRIRLNGQNLWFATYSTEMEHTEELVKFINDTFKGQIAETPLIESLRELWNLNDVQHNDRTIRNRIKAAVESGAIRMLEIGGVIIYETVKEEK